MATVEQLEEQIFDTITSLRNSNEASIYCTISKTKTTKSLNKETLRESLNRLLLAAKS